VLLELEEQKLINISKKSVVSVVRDQSLATKRDSSYFRTADPNVDPIQVIDVLKTIPHGKFQKILSILFFVSFLATSTLSFNFAFFLLPQAYKCPADMVSKKTLQTETLNN
jgi:hypothetical protein